MHEKSQIFSSDCLFVFHQDKKKKHIQNIILYFDFKKRKSKTQISKCAYYNKKCIKQEEMLRNIN